MSEQIWGYIEIGGNLPDKLVEEFLSTIGDEITDQKLRRIGDRPEYIEAAEKAVKNWVK